FAPPFRLAHRKRLVRAVIGAPEMVDAGQQQTEIAALGRDTTDRETAEPNAVVAALAANEPRSLSLTARPVIGERDLHRRVGCFAAGTGEEHMLEAGRGQNYEPVGQL